MRNRSSDDPDQDNGTKLLNYCIVIGPGRINLTFKAKAGNRLGSLQVPWDWSHSGQSFPWLSRVLGFCVTVVYLSINVGITLCSFNSQGDFFGWNDLAPFLVFGHLSHSWGSQHDLGPTVRPQSSQMRLAPQF
ncbi:hypothetical protein TNCV_2934571 [Trichonephila clavipes]|nr:hypothetical protein TNCV_2934571 [Trichonephila clavipes]